MLYDTILSEHSYSSNTFFWTITSLLEGHAMTFDVSYYKMPSSGATSFVAWVGVDRFCFLHDCF